MTRELNEQWVEVIDGKRHMLKAVPPLSIYDGKSINGRTCHGCSFVDEWDDDCTLKNPPCRISEHKAGPFIIKDLGILNEDGCLPSPWGGYPKIIHEVDQNRTENGEDVYYDNLWCVEIHEPVLVCTDEYPTKQQAIAAWNRRLV